jgi:hypothetical protein
MLSILDIKEELECVSDTRESKVLKAIKTIEYLHSILGHEFVESVSIQSF